jgi:hypothetical protein
MSRLLHHHIAAGLALLNKRIPIRSTTGEVIAHAIECIVTTLTPELAEQFLLIHGWLVLRFGGVLKDTPPLPAKKSTGLHGIGVRQNFWQLGKDTRFTAAIV